MQRNSFMDWCDSNTEAPVALRVAYMTDPADTDTPDEDNAV